MLWIRLQVFTSKGYGTFLKLLRRWVGSIYKLVWKELLIYVLVRLFTKLLIIILGSFCDHIMMILWSSYDHFVYNNFVIILWCLAVSPTIVSRQNLNEVTPFSTLHFLPNLWIGRVGLPGITLQLTWPICKKEENEVLLT
jgi:hypothetical protein